MIKITFSTRCLSFVGGASIIFVALFLLFGVASSRASEKVDLLLVLAADISHSVDTEKFKLQREGYGKAITDRGVLSAIRSGPIGSIGVCFIEWSDSFWQDLVVDWTLIKSEAAARHFSEKIIGASRSSSGRTSISAAIDFAVAQFERAPFESARQIIDISGDGDNNAGRGVTSARDEALARGVTINGLVILSDGPHDHTNPLGGLEEYYRSNVIGGRGAFVTVSQDFRTFGNAIIRKLTTEIAHRLPLSNSPKGSTTQREQTFLPSGRLAGTAALPSGRVMP